jgi:hypothetical protein
VGAVKKYFVTKQLTKEIQYDDNGETM